ncbi:MAG: biotin--[acetyl-CoA-carboxylase] ligase [Bdellovibrionaceae bacterium]|nr:biotin--[acetyl-CoA-carboxylase] ligase [Pseudobdellovibrionaceae bacterium]
MLSINKKCSEWLQSHGIPSHYTATIDSTNTWAKKECHFHIPLEVFFADHQTAGRGRNNNQWIDRDHGATLLSTWSLALTSAPQPVANIKIGYSVYDALQSSWPHIPFALKAPNDIYIEDGKLAGILTEVISQGTSHHMFIGLGMNILNHPKIPQQKTTSLCQYDTFEDTAWIAFLSILSKNLRELAPQMAFPYLDDQEKQSILTALKRYVKNPVYDLQNDGTLILSDGRLLAWNEL